MNEEPSNLTEVRKQTVACADLQTEKVTELSSQEKIQLIHQLQSHQIELERQNEELLRTQEELLQITERPQANTFLLESEEQYRAVLENTPILICRSLPGGEILYANKSYCEYFGKTSEELIGTSFLLLVPEAERKTVMANILEMTAESPDQSHEHQAIAPNGEIRWHRWTNRILFSKSGHPVTYQAIGEDITDRKLAEQESQKRQDREARQRDAIAELATHPAIASGDFPDGLQEISRVAAETLQVERASIWLLSEDQQKLHCISLYNSKARQHSDGEVMNAEEHPLYFKSILSENRVSATDVRSDDRTRTFAESYLIPLGVFSLLDVAIVIEGKLAGVLCLEHTGSQREWHSDEEFFADTTAALVALSLANTDRKQAEKELLESEVKYRTLVESSPYCIREIDTQGRLLSMSPAGLKMLNKTDECDVLGTSYNSAVCESDRKRIATILDCAFTGEYSEFEFLAVNGKEYRSVFTPIYDTDNKVNRLLSITQDITNYKNSERDLQASELRNRRLVDNSPYGIAIHCEGKFKYTNSAMAEILGTTSELLYDKPILDFVHPDFHQAARKRIDQVLSNNSVVQSLEYTLLTIDGGLIETEVVGVPSEWEGKPAVQIMVRDITDHKKAERDLQASELRYRRLIDNSPYGIAIHCEGKFKYTNSAMVEILGASPEALYGKSILDFVHSDFHQSGLKRVSQVLTNKRIAQRSEQKFLQFDGAIVDVDVVGIPTEWEGRPAVQIMVRDITDHKKAERDLQASETRYRSLVDNSPDGIAIHCEGKLKYTNSAMAEMLGATSEFLKDKLILDFVPSDYQPITLIRIDQILSEEVESQRYEQETLRVDGTSFIADVVSIPSSWEEKPANQILVRDITKRKWSEEVIEAVRHSTLDVFGDAFFKSVVQAITSLMQMNYVCVAESNQSHGPYQILAQSSESGFGETSEFPMSKTLCESVMDNKFLSHYGNLSQQFPKEIIFKSNQYECFFGVPMFTSEGKSLGMIYTLSRSKPPAWVDPETLLTLFAAMCGMEIERYRAAELLYNQQIARKHAGRVATIGQLASGIVHELTQPLYAISNFSAACRNFLKGVEFDDRAKAIDSLNLISKSTTGAQEIVKRYRDFLQSHDIQRSAVVIDKLAAEVIKLLSFEIRSSRVKVVCEIPRDTKVFANSVQIQQVFVNLILNACEALQNTTADIRHIQIKTKIQDNEVTIMVEDNGPGISEEVAKQLFEPFFSTKEKGLGIGMSITEGIIRDHDGKIWFTTTPEIGTTFYFTLPLYREQ